VAAVFHRPDVAVLPLNAPTIGSGQQPPWIGSIGLRWQLKERIPYLTLENFRVPSLPLKKFFPILH
jgi:hypothetical protein